MGRVPGNAHGRLLFRLQFGVVLADERLDLRCARQDAEPLFFVERDWKAAHAIQRHCAFLAHLEADKGDQTLAEAKR
jgi:hypothetical protein